MLCDFDAGVLRIFKRDVSSIALRELWMRLAHYKSPEGHGNTIWFDSTHPPPLPTSVFVITVCKFPFLGFFDTLHWTGNGPKVWEILQDLRPTILTGLPRGNWAEKQKRRWCKENLGEHVPVICCLSKVRPVMSNHSGVMAVFFSTT